MDARFTHLDLLKSATVRAGLSLFRCGMKTLGKFEIIEKIGQGAMGMVYKARDPFIGRLVALKTITTGLSEDANLLERFYQEARSAGTLAHPNIVTIFELGKEGDTPFIAMEFIEGGSLDKLIEKRVPMSVAQKVGYVVQICRALEYAHSKGVVHRDIKPGNVMVTAEGGVKVVDFGIARLVGSGKTQTGLLIGTLGYMSPQQIRGKSADARSDIWAVGIMFDELLTGERPFGGENHADLMMNILTAPLSPVTSIVPDVPIEVERVITKMLQRDVENRYQSMQEVLIDLNPIWERMLGEEVSRLLASARQLFDDGNLSQARELANRAFQHDTTNVRAKTLLEKIDSEDRRRRVFPQVKALVEKGQNFLSIGRPQEAKAAAEEARQLNSSYQPALDLSAQAEAQIQREIRLNDAVRTGSQRLAVGELSEAEAQLALALEIDRANASALDLQRRIQDEKARRDRQKRLSEIKHQARTLWSELRYDECIDLLDQARTQFPGDPEIADMLVTARQDKADHERQAFLTEARGLLGAERFDDAIKLLDHILSESPSDSTVLNLRARAIQGQDRQIRQHHLQRDLGSLHSLIKDGKYQEAIGRGHDLLRQYPKETEIEELVRYAQAEQLQQERRQRREQWLDRINRGVASEKYADAVKSAEMALEQFPGDQELKDLLQKAKELKVQRDRAELISRRVSEMRTKINREEFTDAIKVGQQTIASFGNDTDIAQLLNEATFEIGAREKKKETQRETIQAAQTMVDQGDSAGAMRVLDEGFATKIFSRSDPQVAAILQRIEEREAPPPPAPRSTPKPSSAPVSPAWTAPSQEPGRDYVYQQAPNLSEPSPSVPQDASIIFSPTPASNPSVQPIPSPPPPLPEPKPALKPPKPKRKEPARAEQAASATTFAQPAPSIEEQVDATIVPSAVVAPPRPPVETIPRPAARPLWMQPAGIAIIGLLIATIVGGAAYLLHSSKSSPNVMAEQHSTPQPPVPQPGASQRFTPQPASPQRRTPQPVVPQSPAPQSRTQPPTSQPAASQPTPQLSTPQSPPPQPLTPPQPTAVLPTAQLPTSQPSAQQPPAAQPPTPQPLAPEPAQPANAQPPTPQPPTSQPSAPQPTAQQPLPQVEIKKVLDDFSSAFGHKDLNSLRGLWPSMPPADVKTLTETFHAAKAFARNFNPATINVNGDSATVSGTYSGEFTIGSKPTPSNGSFQATLRKNANRWLIVDLKM